ncbi:hypothetical protein QBC34DRAFT_439140 [Podospora aff. communis PSN243]|uniref:BTB domain-containing protein n=1 Tax=Podospora aff. communis PSN243 TaxID=3040156 RepID=A0AAV9GHZ2_9PEZI|nr:hypothetical protein QBC34DRAFT_439140 [Podospora aff. communis PSN243]
MKSLSSDIQHTTTNYKLQATCYFRKLETILPFTSTDLVVLRFRGAQQLTVHRSFLDKAPKLAALIQADPTPIIHLQHMTLPSGHILANYLYTNAYEPLEWRGSTTGNAEILSRSIRPLTDTALAELAKVQVAEISTDVDPMLVISVVHEVCPMVPADDAWFPVYLKALTMVAFRNAADVVDADWPSKGSVPLAKFLFKAAVQAYQAEVGGETNLEPASQTEVEVGVEMPAPRKNKSKKSKKGKTYKGRRNAEGTDVGRDDGVEQTPSADSVGMVVGAFAFSGASDTTGPPAEGFAPRWSDM